MTSVAVSGTLTASTVATVNFNPTYKSVVVYNLGSTPIYATTDSSAPTVAGAGMNVIPANTAQRLTNRLSSSFANQGEATLATPGTVVKLISSGTPSYTVDPGGIVPAAASLTALVDYPTTTDARYLMPSSLVQTIALVGDSIATNSGAIDVSTATNTQQWNATGWAHIANALTGHRLQVIYPGATGPGSLADPNTALHSSTPSGVGFCLGGLTAAEVLSLGYMDAAVASAANIIVVEPGTNDVNAGTDGATIAATLLTLWRKATAVGKRVIACTILPRDSTVITGSKLTALNLANRLIRKNAATEPGVFLCDWHAVMLDSAGAAPSGSSWSSWYQDGLHPNEAGAWRMGTAMANVITMMIGARTPSDHLLIDPSDVLTPNPIAAGGSTTATSWTITNVGSPTSVTPSKVARTDLIPGAWQQIVCVAATANTDGWSITITDSTTSTWNTGDVVYAFAEIQVDASGWDCRELQLDAVKTGVSTIASANNIGTSHRTQLTTALGPAPTGGLVLVTPRVTLDASLTAVRAVLRFFGSGTVRVGRMGVAKVA